MHMYITDVSDNLNKLSMLIFRNLVIIKPVENDNFQNYIEIFDIYQDKI